jgi:hypothetical protein
MTAIKYQICTWSLSVIILLSMPLAFSACVEEDELPPITKEGKNTFGCFVDGKLWLPERRLGGTAMEAQLQVSSDSVGVNIYANGATSVFIMSIYDGPTLQINKRYDLSSKKFYAAYTNWSGGSSCDYDSIIDGSITLSRFYRGPETAPGLVISGVFEFTARSTTECDGTVTITEGRFDMGY